MPTLASPECLQAYTVLCTDFPEVDEPRLRTLESAIEANDPNCPLCVPLLSGAAHGATANRTGQPAIAAYSEVPGLVASAAPPACYAAVYASCVLRSCVLLTQTDDAISAALGLYVLPQAPAPASDAVEVVVPESSGADEEVWAAEADGDDVEYEPFAPSMPPASSAMAVSALASKRCSAAEAHERLGHLLGSLSHDALAALDPAEWAKRGLGDAVRTALRQLAEPRWTSVLSPVALRQADGALACMLRDHLLYNPSACIAELPTTLGALLPPRRPLFLASLIGGGGTGRLAVAPSAAWDAVDVAVRNELVPLLQALDEAARVLVAAAPTALDRRRDGHRGKDCSSDARDDALFGTAIGRVGSRGARSCASAVACTGHPGARARARAARTLALRGTRAPDLDPLRGRPTSSR